MRSFKLTMVLCSLMLVLAPKPAHAWFELLDYLSGPGPFRGQKLDFRVWCSGPEIPLSKLDKLVAAGVVKTFSVRDQGGLDQAKSAWREVVTLLTGINDRLDLFDSNQLTNLSTRIEALKTTDFTSFLRADQPPQPPEAAEALQPGALKDLVDQMELILDQLYVASASLASTGIFVSFCSETQREFALEVGFTTLQANSDPAWARDYTIRLNTFTAALSYRLPLPADRDIVDVGVIGGMYRFSSRGFDTIRGTVFEPFVDLHGPTRTVNNPGLSQIGALLTLRIGLVWFPGGFDTEDFAAVPAKVGHISGWEATPSATIFFNLTPLLKHRTRTF